MCYRAEDLSMLEISLSESASLLQIWQCHRKREMKVESVSCCDGKSCGPKMTYGIATVMEESILLAI